MRNWRKTISLFKMSCNSKMGGPGSGRIAGGKKTVKTQTQTKQKPRAQTEVGKKKVGGSVIPFLQSNASERSKPEPKPKPVENNTLSKSSEPESEFQRIDRENKVKSGYNNLVYSVIIEYEKLLPKLATVYQKLDKLVINKAKLYEAFETELNLELNDVIQIFSWQLSNARDPKRTGVFIKKGIDFKTQVTKSYDILKAFCKTACIEMNSKSTKKDNCESISENSDGIINKQIKEANDVLISVKNKIEDIKKMEGTLSEYKKKYADILYPDEDIIKGGSKKLTTKSKKPTTTKTKAQTAKAQTKQNRGYKKKGGGSPISQQAQAPLIPTTHNQTQSTSPISQQAPRK